MTVSDMAMPSGSPSRSVDRPWASARPRARVAATQRDRKISRVGARLGSLGGVVYQDAADSWLVNGRSPSVKDLWTADYAAGVPGRYTPFVLWCRMWRVVAVAAALPLDVVKFLLAHPVRGPLTVCTAITVIATVALTNL